MKGQERAGRPVKTPRTPTLGDLQGRGRADGLVGSSIDGVYSSRPKVADD